MKVLKNIFFEEIFQKNICSDQVSQIQIAKSDTINVPLLFQIIWLTT